MSALPPVQPIMGILNMPTGSIVSVRGKVVEVGDTQPVYTGPFGPREVRDDEIKDETGTISIAFWGKFVNVPISEGDFVQINGVLLTEYRELPKLWTVETTQIQRLPQNAVNV